MDLGTTSTCLVLGVPTQRKTLPLVLGSNLLRLAHLWIPRMPLFFPRQEARPITPRLWYDVNTAGVGNRTYSFILGSPVAIFNRTSGTDGIGIANQWQLLVAVMDKENRKLYLNGELVSQSTSPTSLITLEGNDGRIGSWDEDSGADFEGQIDELRIYGTSFSQADVNALWNLGSGDLGIVPVVDMSTDHSAAEINGTIRFYQVGNQVTVSGFDESDISIEGASLRNFSEDGSGGYEITILPDRPGIPISLSISDQAATGTDGTTLTGATSTRFHQSPTVTAQDNLVMWYNFEGNDSKTVYDLSPDKSMPA